MTPDNAPAFVRAPLPVKQAIYTAVVAHSKHGLMSPETGDATCILDVARSCAELCKWDDDPGLQDWDRWTVREYETGKDVTAEAIRELVAYKRQRRRPGHGLEVPAWWAEYDASLDAEDLDTWDENDGEDWSAQALRREFGTY